MKKHHRPFQKSLGYALAGIFLALRYEAHMRFHMAVALLILPLAFLFRFALWEWAYLLISVTLVLFAELMNTAVEASVDLVTREIREQARIAKDVAAGAVLITSFHALVAGCLLFLPRIMNFVL